MELDQTAHGTRIRMANGHVLTMNRDYPRPAFDVVAASGEYLGYIYPHNVAADYDVTEISPDAAVELDVQHDPEYVAGMLEAHEYQVIREEPVPDRPVRRLLLAHLPRWQEVEQIDPAAQDTPYGHQ